MFGPTILDVAIRKDNLNIRRNTMSSIKRFMQFLLMLCLLCGFILLTALHLFAQGTNSTIPIPVVPSGFDWWYIVLFAAGMVIHFIVHVIKTADLRTLVKTFLAQFVGWFFNKWHFTAISCAAAAVLGTAAQWNLNVPFATLNAMGIAVAIASGYIGDSVFNNGKPAKQIAADKASA